MYSTRITRADAVFPTDLTRSCRRLRVVQSCYKVRGTAPLASELTVYSSMRCLLLLALLDAVSQLPFRERRRDAAQRECPAEGGGGEYSTVHGSGPLHHRCGATRRHVHPSLPSFTREHTKHGCRVLGSACVEACPITRLYCFIAVQTSIVPPRRAWAWTRTGAFKRGLFLYTSPSPY